MNLFIYTCFYGEHIVPVSETFEIFVISNRMDEAFLNDLLECSVCLEQLDSNSKVLPCQHTFCKRCLEEIVNSHKELRCPECRVLVETNIDDLPCNILLIRLLEGIKNNPRLRNTNFNGTDHGNRRPDFLPQNSHILPLPPVLHPPITRPLLSTVAGDGRTMPKQILQSLPCAKALYPYEAKQASDLSFNKGDIIILKKRIDQNWYQGELNGKGGFLPASYIQVMVPLPPHLPQCKALYDFCITDSEEKDCLSFSKGDIITVIRRVDDNWVEGKLGERIGIYPISFVEMNASARALMKLSSNIQVGPSRVAPPTPTTDSKITCPSTTTTTTITTTTESVTAPANDSLSSTTTSPSPASSSTSPSPSSSSSSSSSSFSSSSFPSTVPVTTQVTAVTSCSQPTVTSESVSVCHTFIRDSFQYNNQCREKRHSFSALSVPQRSPQMPGVHRHSMEILNSVDVITVPTSLSSVLPNQSPYSTVNPTVNLSVQSSSQRGEVSGVRVIRRHSSRKERESSQGSSTEQCTPNSINNVVQTSSHASLPTFYTALYNYRPQKEDELELKKGELYTVSEKCQDGWFKGTSLRTKCSGVFPGNYVHIAKSPIIQPQYQTAASVANVRSTTSKSLGVSQQILLSTTTTNSKPSSGNNTTQLQTEHKQMIAISNVNTSVTSLQINSSPSIYSHVKSISSQDDRTAPLVGAFDWSELSVPVVSTPQRPPRPHQPLSNTSSPVNQRSQASPKLNTNICSSQDKFSTDGNWPTNWKNLNVTITTGAEFQSLAVPKMTASYPALGTNSGNITQSTVSTNNSNSITQSWHGGTPFRNNSVLSTAVALTPPNVSVRTTTTSISVTPSSSGMQSKNEKQKERKEKEKISLMKRLTSKRKSKSPPPSNYSCDNPSFVDSVVTNGQASLTAIHVRSGSCPSEVFTSTNHKKMDNVTDISKSSRPRQPLPFSRERFRCIVPYPPNSEYELELKVGDIVYVHKKREDGWYKGTLQRTGKTGLFPASFVEDF